MLTEIIAVSMISLSALPSKGQVNPYEEVATIEIHAYNAQINSHAYLVVNNLTSSNLTVGYVTVAPYDCVTIGKWSSSVLSSSSGISFSGVFYDLEKYAFCHGQSHGDDIYLSSSVLAGEMSSLNSSIRALNDGYNLLTDNCVTFARSIWNSYFYPLVSNIAILPYDLRASIESYSSHQNCGSFSSTSYFYSYDTTSNQLITYS